MESLYQQEDNQKCQCITLDGKGNITGSCDTLFDSARIRKAGVRDYFPFLGKVIAKLKQLKNSDEPLFYPQVEFECNGYHSICDFTFMKTSDARGIDRIIWLIYDNSLHYRHLIHSANFSGFKEGVKRI